MPSAIRVLLVDAPDDDGADRLRRLVAQLPDPVDAESVSSFGEGFERMTSRRFDVHLLASRVGGGSGLELLRAYREAGGEGPVLLVADPPDRAEDLAAMESGAADYLDRGRLDATLLERRIRYAVEASRHAASLRRVRDELEARVLERTDALETMNAALVAEVADRRAAERALREADRRKDEFLATLAHELRNPLAPLTTATEILSRTGDGDEDRPRRERALGVLQRQIGHMTRLIGDLLDVSRITHGKLELRRERVSVARLVESALETARPLLAARRQELQVVVPEVPVFLHVDPVRLAQALTNLLSNAAKYTEPGGRVRLEVTLERRDVVFSVIDSGIGIPAEHLAHVFTMFGQGHRASQAVYGGLGVGLALARRLVELHGGTLTAASAGEGKGSVFTLRVGSAPAVLSAPPPPELPASAPPPPLRVLVVDDNVEAALTLAELLSLRGHETHVAHDGPSGVASARRLKPDVAIFDLGLPGFDGYEAARRLRADGELAGLVLLALSGWVQDADRARSREAGFDDHLAKPVQLRTLELALRESRANRGRTP